MERSRRAEQGKFTIARGTYSARLDPSTRCISRCMTWVNIWPVRTRLYSRGRLPEILTSNLMAIETPRMRYWTEWQWATLPHVSICFGQWVEIIRLESPANPSLLCISVATVNHVKGTALALLGRIENSREAGIAFEESRRTVPANCIYGPAGRVEPV
jgi:hypothetical protein